MRIIVLVIVSVVLGGCGEFKYPVTGQWNNQPAAGQAVVSAEGGSFWVSTADGQKCSGYYDPFDTNPTITVPIHCTDKRFGNAVITRDLSGISGTAIASLNDGSKGQFVFGDLKFEQVFGQGVVKAR